MNVIESQCGFIPSLLIETEMTMLASVAAQVFILCIESSLV